MDKIKYEKPIAMDLGPTPSIVGASCAPGEWFDAAGDCNTVGNAAFDDCEVGYGATDDCETGNSAGDECESGLGGVD